MSNAIVGALRVTLGIDTAAFDEGVKKAGENLQSVGKKLMGVGAAISAVGAGIGLAIKGQLDAADELAKTAQKIGIPVEAPPWRASMRSAPA